MSAELMKEFEVCGNPVIGEASANRDIEETSGNLDIEEGGGSPDANAREPKREPNCDMSRNLNLDDRRCEFDRRCGGMDLAGGPRDICLAYW